MVIAAPPLLISVHLILQYTKPGNAWSPMADNKDLALITGIPTERVVLATWVIGAGLAGVAGYLVVLDRGTITYNLGWFLLLLIFAAVILGGIGSVYGAMAGALLIGMIHELTPLLSQLGRVFTFLPEGFGLPIGNQYGSAIAFVIMVIVLLFRPQGIAGEAV
jgi:branched-chain amino acid transport system permease protein